MQQNNSAAEIHLKILESAGTAILNRAHSRTFSFNVFQMNAMELIEAVRRVKDPSQGMALMMTGNREAGTQAHRELNRHVHNFVSSALTLVEHTRIHMRKHYEGTDLMATYVAKVVATFSQSPIAQFVQGLRNYMLHRGLPNSQMFMKFTATPGATNGSGTTKTGITISVDSLQKWDGWKLPARTYLERAGVSLDVQEFAQEYLVLVYQFQEWLEASIADHHRHELEELNELHLSLEAAELQVTPTDVSEVGSSESSQEAKSDFTFNKIDDLDRIALELFEKIHELHFQKHVSGFPSEREAVIITAQELIEPMVYWSQVEDGTSAIAFIQREGKDFGLGQSDYESIDALITCIKKSEWARESVSDKFTEDVFIEWARNRFLAGPSETFSVALIASVRQNVIPVEVWAPIAYMEVEEAFSFGPVFIEPVTSVFMERLAGMLPSQGTGHQEAAKQLLSDIKSKFQGTAAVRISLSAEPKMAQDRALQLAQDTVGLLRFFSPQAATSYLFSPLSLHGSECIPIARLMLLHETGLIYSESSIPNRIEQWRLSKQQFTKLQSPIFEAAASLVNVAGLSTFALALRASILAYSKSMTLVDPLDRLRNCISAVEGVFLKHEMEPRVHCVANRMALLIGDLKDREPIMQTVRQIYWLQNEPRLNFLCRREKDLIFAFTNYAHHALQSALGNISNFKSKSQFLEAVDRMCEGPARR